MQGKLQKLVQLQQQLRLFQEVQERLKCLHKPEYPLPAKPRGEGFFEVMLGLGLGLYSACCSP